MEIFGAAVGIIVGVAILAVALWRFPKLRLGVLIEPGAIAVFALLGGWAGYRIFSMLFHG